MNKLDQAVKDIHKSDETGVSSITKGGVHPLARVVITLFYIGMVVSFPMYELAGLAGIALYLPLQMIWYELSVRTMLKRVWPVLLLAGLVGIAGPVLDREVCVTFGAVTITYGMVSMLTLMLKGIFCVIASYILAVTAGLGQICHALRLLHMPQEIVTVIMLIHRYLMVLIKEVKRMQQAYRLRAPGQKGLRFRAGGSFVGLLLLRSMDRAEGVQDSMELRGFHGRLPVSSLQSSTGVSILYALLWGIVLFILRIFPVFQMVGSFF